MKQGNLVCSEQAGESPKFIDVGEFTHCRLTGFDSEPDTQARYLIAAHDSVGNIRPHIAVA
jgi:hypothetical protein